MAAALRVQQAELNGHREEALRQQQLISVATLAAGTAHELGTPLSTMTLLLDDMLDDAGAGSDDAEQAWTAELRLVRRQVEGGRQVLHMLAATAGTHEHRHV